MTLLILGLALWTATHSIPTLAIPFREQLIHRIGKLPYRGLFATLILSSVALMISGWRSVDPLMIYVLPAWSIYITTLLVFAALMLMVATRVKTNLKQVVRHPLLTGLAVWGVGHLLSNGDSRSIALFGGLASWAIVEIWLINRREGDWVKPEPVTIKSELITASIAVGLFILLFLTHPYFAGVPLVA